MRRLLVLLAVLLAAPASRAQWEILPTPVRSYNGAPLPASTFTTFGGVLVGAFDNYDATDGCGSCWVTYASADAGQTWTLVRDPDGALFSMGSFDARDGVLYGSHGYPSDDVHSGRAYRSIDGVTWTLAAPATGTGSVSGLQVTADGALWSRGVDPASSREIISRSQGGDPWADVTGTLDNQYSATTVGATDDRVFARTAYHVYFREASGGDWAIVPTFDSGIPRAMDDDGETLYATATVSTFVPVPPYYTATYLQRSTDGGATWAGVDSFPAVTADRVAASAGGGVAVTLSSSQTALAVSLDAGATWTTLAPPQAREFVDVARIEGDYLYALSSGDKRLYRYPIASLATATDAAPEAVGLALRVAPNPTHGAARLAVTLAEGEDVRVTLHDALGRTVVALERTFGAGPQTLDLDTSGLAPGVYVAHVTAGGVVGSVRFTVAR